MSLMYDLQKEDQHTQQQQQQQQQCTLSVKDRQEFGTADGTALW
jgi:hypothetical protein